MLSGRLRVLTAGEPSLDLQRVDHQTCSLIQMIVSENKVVGALKAVLARAGNGIGSGRHSVSVLPQ